MIQYCKLTWGMRKSHKRALHLKMALELLCESARSVQPCCFHSESQFMLGEWVRKGVTHRRKRLDRT